MGSDQTKTANKLNADERKLITQALAFYHKSSLRAANTSTEQELKDHHTAKATKIQALQLRMQTQELDI